MELAVGQTCNGTKPPATKPPDTNEYGTFRTLDISAQDISDPFLRHFGPNFLGHIGPTVDVSDPFINPFVY